jgi:hypothetical protein
MPFPVSEKKISKNETIKTIPEWEDIIKKNIRLLGGVKFTKKLC